MSSTFPPGVATKDLPGTIGFQPLSIALIGPDQKRRKAVAAALAESGQTTISEFETYPKRPEEFRWMLQRAFDVIVVDLDCDPAFVLDLVERIRASNSTTVMVYSERADTKLAVRYVRAGAREYLLLPLEDGIVAEALERAAGIRREKPRQTQGLARRKATGDLLVFFCAKGGCGATTVACNLAVALAGDPDQKTLLIDLALPIGDAALALGISAKYSTEDAIRNAGRLDASLLRELVVKHQSGLFVLAAPNNISGGNIREIDGCEDAIDKLIEVARREFDHVVVDVGSRIDLMETALFKKASTVYLVTLGGISELRNSSLLISQFFMEEGPAGGPNLEVVMNRFESRMLGAVKEEDVTRALGRPVRWKVPEDHEVAREMQYGATGLGKTRLSYVSLEMAAAITGREVPEGQKLSRGGPGRTAAEDSFSSAALLREEIAPPAPVPVNPVIEWTPPAAITYGDVLSSAQLNATASVAGTLVYTPAPGTVLPAGTHELSVAFTPADDENYTTAEASVTLEVERSTPDVAWPKPAPIAYGTPLGAGQLCAMASVPGTFDYAPAQGVVLGAGIHALSAKFLPADSENYIPVEAETSLEVTKAIPSIAWAAPHSMLCDTALGDAQLCATSPVAGRFDYTPGPGQELRVGTHTLSVTFTPKDSANYATANASVPIRVVDRPASVIPWTSRDPRGAAAETQTLPGTSSGGFSPTRSVNYTAATRSTVSQNVEKKAPEIELWPTARPIDRDLSMQAPGAQPMKHGKPLRAPHLEAAPVVPETRKDVPARVGVLAPRETDFPEDAAEYNPPRAKTHVQAHVQVEALPDASRAPAGPRIQAGPRVQAGPKFKEIPEPVQEPVVSEWLRAAETTKEAPAAPDPLDKKPDQTEEKHPQETAETRDTAKKRWMLAAAGAGSVLLVAILAIRSFHPGAKAPVSDAAAVLPVSTDSQVTSDSNPQPLRKPRAGRGETVAVDEGVKPTPVQTELMENQLAAPGRIPQYAQRHVAVNAPAPPPPSNFAIGGAGAGASSLGGESAIGKLFGQKAPSVVAAPPRGPLAVSAGTAMGLITRKYAPVYPDIAKQARVSGIVQLEVTISKAGTIEEVHVLSGPAMLRDAAVEAVRTWRFRPYIVNNEPIEIKTTISIGFSLNQ